MPEIDPEQAWREACSWEEHERAQLRDWARLPFAEKLEALEEMYEVAMHLYRSGEKRRQEELRERREESPQ